MAMAEGLHRVWANRATELGVIYRSIKVLFAFQTFFFFAIYANIHWGKRVRLDPALLSDAPASENGGPELPSAKRSLISCSDATKAASHCACYLPNIRNFVECVSTVQVA